jgi:hypothetical protein
MGPRIAITTLTAIACLPGARMASAARHAQPQAVSSARVPSPTATLGTALITPLQQSRSIHASAHADYSSSQSAWAPDFGPFSDSVAASAGGFDGWAGAGAGQDSEILDEAIVATGGASCSGSLWNLGPTSDSQSALEVRFSVGTPVAYRASGLLGTAVMLDGSDSLGHVELELLDARLTSLFSVGTTSPEDLVIDESGLLAPGEYVLVASASVGGGTWYWDTSAWFDFRFEVEPCDTAPPTLFYPPVVHVLDAKDGPPGDFAFFSVTATDLCDPSPSVVCVPPSGSYFPRGTTMVTCTAKDASGNQAVGTFPVVVLPSVRRR